MAEPERTQWHIKKEVSVSHIITTATIVVSAIAWGMQVESRIAMIENAHIVPRLTTLEVNRVHDQDTLIRIEKQLQRILDKLDTKADKD
ncbi:MAG: hypothetical protein CMF31_04990 [Kordiimonas sp.]|nr:hypothetical protein [Kordiimonas sp.]|tara:strand:+ start:323 stop:589 length:267 start_codon:yes stop_codon:yes gene_type:complete